MKQLVLIVDPDENARKALTILFTTMKGWFPVVAANGKEALKLLAEQKIDLIVTEVQMPELSGTDLIKEVRANSKTAPAILVVSKSCPVPPKEILALGANGFMPKPINRAQFLEALTKIFPKVA